MAIVINGSGTVTGLAVGGLPDGTVDAGTLATDSVITGKIADGTITNADLATKPVEATSVTNTAGQDWAGVAYTDPDAVGASPTAKIYPDGTVVGSTANGSYTKYPNGDYHMYVPTVLTSYTWTASGSLYYSLHSILDDNYPLDTSSITPLSVSVGKAVRGSGVAWASIRSINSGSIGINLWQASASTSGSWLFTLELKGRWK